MKDDNSKTHYQRYRNYIVSTTKNQTYKRVHHQPVHHTPRRLVMAVLRVFAVALLHISLVVGDIPVNCSHSDIVGEWIFHVGQDGHDNSINCTNFGNGSGRL